MADIASIAQGAQIGVETTPGTVVAANRVLQSLSLVPKIEGEAATFRPDGTKYPTLTIPGKEWSSYKAEGKLTYSDMTYVLQSLIRKITPVQIGVTLGYTHTIAPQNATEDVRQTYTIEKGAAIRAVKSAYGVFTDLSIDITRDSCDVSGSLMAQRITDNITMTATPTNVELTPVLPRLFDIYLDPTSGALGTTKLLRQFQASIGFSGMIGPVWPINSAVTSFDAHVETEPKVEFKLWMEADAAGMANLPIFRAGTTQFVRLKAVGDNIGAAADYTFQFDAAIKVKSASEYSDRDGVYGVEWSFDVVNDSGWGKPFQFVLVNKISPALF